MPESSPVSTPAASRIGLVTPVVVCAPGTHSPWETDAGVAEPAPVAQAADELGSDHRTCNEHLAVPSEAVPRRGGAYGDPPATFGYLAGHTRRIRLAKRYGTVDPVCGGLLGLGLGIGILEEDFAPPSRRVALSGARPGSSEPAAGAGFDLGDENGRREAGA